MMSLEVAAMRWLWIEKRCHYVLRERYPKFNNGEPDVIGITRDRYLIEIEIKRSYSDFLADNQKRHRRHRDDYLKFLPKFFYYLCEKQLSDKVLGLVPEWAGLLYLENCSVWVEKSAPVNKFSEKLNLRECVKAGRQMVNHMMSLEIKVDHQMNNWVQGRYYDAYPIDGDFQI